jgi:hypothetical protein
MSRVLDTKRAFDKLSTLLDQEVRNRRGPTHDLEQFRRTMNVAFYLLGWAQFEFLMRREADSRIKSSARGHTLDAQAWKYLQENIKNVSIRQRLDILFHSDPKLRGSLHDDYTVRNDAAHDYKLPTEAGDVAAWLQSLEDIIKSF